MHLLLKRAWLIAFWVWCFLGFSAAWAETPPLPSILVQEFKVAGNTVLSPDEIDEIVSPFLWQQLTFESLKQIADHITEAYHKKGYLLAKAHIPAQSVQEGVVQIVVNEGGLGELKIEGNRAYRADFIRFFLSPAFKGGLIQFEKLEKGIMLLNEFPNLHVESILAEGSHPGKIDVLIKVKDKTPINESVELNNFGNRLVGKTRAGLGISYGNMTGRGDVFSASMVAPFPSNENPFLSAAYSIPLDSVGTNLRFSYSNADIKVGEELQVLDIRASASIYGIIATRPLVRTSRQKSNLSLGVYVKNTTNFVLGGTLASRDKLREIVVSYNHRWPTGTADHFIDVSVAKGLGNWFGGMQKNDPLASRLFIDNTFTKVNAEYNQVRRVFDDKFLVLHGAGQWAGGPLSATEQYSLGGPNTVHGFPQSELLGDSGWNLNAELRFPLTQQNSSDIVHLVVFLDTGFVSLRNPQPGQTALRHLTGTGFGFRSTLGASTLLRLDLGIPIDPNFNSIHENPVLYFQGILQL